MWIDLHNFETATRSLHECLDVEAGALIDALRNYEEDRSDDPYLLMPVDILGCLGVAGAPANVEGAYCFHGTRSMNPEGYLKRGLLPLGQSLDQIWSDLFELVNDVSPDSWAKSRHALEYEAAGGDWGRLYRLKANADPTSLESGPFGFFVRDCLLRASEEGLSNFLCGPETVQDVCRAFQTETGIDLEDRWLSASSACIVKFRYRADQETAIRCGLWFLYGAMRDGSLGNACEGVANLAGEPVAPGDVISSELLPIDCRHPTARENPLL